MANIKQKYCSYPGCSSKHYGRGLCQIHLQRQKYAMTKYERESRRAENERIKAEKLEIIYKSQKKLEYNGYIIKAIPASQYAKEAINWSMAIVRKNKHGDIVYIAGMPAVFATADLAITAGINLIKMGVK